MKKNKSKKIIYICIILGIIAFLTLTILKRDTSSIEEIKAEISDIKTYYSFTGNIEAKNNQTVYADKLLQISDLKVKEGDKVKKDDVLFSTTDGNIITASIDGEISKINAEENEPVIAGSEIMNIIDYDELQLKIDIDEYDLSAVEKGNTAQISINALDKNIKGTIEEISKEGTEINGITYFNSTISLEENENLRIGMSAEVKILKAEVEDAVILPMTVIEFDESNEPYITVLEDNKQVKKDITIGITDGIDVEIKEGLEESDYVIVPQEISTSGFGMNRNQQSTINNTNSNSSENGGV
jgi:HlyD family secretion protein